MLSKYDVQKGAVLIRTILAAWCKKGLMEYYAREATLETPRLRHVHVECFQTLKQVSLRLKHTINNILQTEKSQQSRVINTFASSLSINKSLKFLRSVL